MALIKRAQEPEGPSPLGGILQSVWSLLQSWFTSSAAQQGLVPRDSWVLYQYLQRQTLSQARAHPVLKQLLDQEVDRSVRRWLQQFHKDLPEQEKELVSSLKWLISFVTPVWPSLLDTLNYPYGGSFPMLASSISAIMAKRPSADPKADADRAVQNALAIWNHFYKDFNLRDPKAVQKTWGMPAGELGMLLQTLYNKGLYDPRAPIEEQIRVIEIFMPATRAAQFVSTLKGVEITPIDAVNVALIHNQALAPTERNTQKLAESILRAGIYHAEVLRRLGSAEPGVMPPEAAQKLHAQLVQQAASSYAAKLFGTYVAAMHSGQIRPGSIAWQIAQEISNGRVPQQFQSVLVGSDLLYRHLTMSGMSPNDAAIWASNPSIGAQFVGPNVVLAVRRYQGVEARVMFMQSAQHLWRYLRASDASPAAARAAIFGLENEIAELYGYPNVNEFKRFHVTLWPNDAEIDDLVNKFMKEPPVSALESGWQRLSEAFLTSKDLGELLYKFLTSFGRPQMPEQPKPKPKPEEGSSFFKRPTGGSFTQFPEVDTTRQLASFTPGSLGGVMSPGFGTGLPNSPATDAWFDNLIRNVEQLTAQLEPKPFDITGLT